MKLPSGIATRKNLDVAVTLRQILKEGDIVVEASITEFSTANDKASILKKITVLGVGESVEEAQTAALANAVELLGESNA